MLTAITETELENEMKLSKNDDAKKIEKYNLAEIDIDKVERNPSQPRKTFENDKITELANSIKKDGLLNPIHVVQREDGKYEIVAGERRWRAHKTLGYKTIKAFIVKYDSEYDMSIASLIENVHRQDLPMDELASYLQYIKSKENIKTVEELAKRVSLSYGYVNKALLYSSLDDDIKGYSKNISPGEIAEVAYTIKDKRKQKTFLNRATKNDWNRTKIRRALTISNNKEGKDVFKALINNNVNIDQAEDILKIKNKNSKKEAIASVKKHNKVANLTAGLMRFSTHKDVEKSVQNKLSTVNKKIIVELNDTKSLLLRAKAKFKALNITLAKMLKNPIEYALDESTLKASLNEMNAITQKVNEINIEQTSFEEKVLFFTERVVNKTEINNNMKRGIK